MALRTRDARDRRLRVRLSRLRGADRRTALPRADAAGVLHPAPQGDAPAAARISPRPRPGPDVPHQGSDLAAIARHRDDVAEAGLGKALSDFKPDASGREIPRTREC